jgi:hypothetical protein
MILLLWPANMGAMAIGGSRHCCAMQADMGTESVSNAFASRGSEGSAKATQAWAAVAERRVMYPATPRISGACLGLRLCRGPNP